MLFVRFSCSGVLRPRRASPNAIASVRHYDRTNEEARPLRGEESDDFRDLFRLGSASDGRVLSVLGQKLTSVRHEVVEQVRHDIARADSVDANSMLDVLACEHAGQLGKSTLGRAVSGDRWKAEKACVGADVHDGTTLLGNHRAHRLAR